jgi:hypothetical protein
LHCIRPVGLQGQDQQQQQQQHGSIQIQAQAEGSKCCLWRALKAAFNTLCFCYRGQPCTVKERGTVEQSWQTPPHSALHTPSQTARAAPQQQQQQQRGSFQIQARQGIALEATHKTLGVSNPAL